MQQQLKSTKKLIIILRNGAIIFFISVGGGIHSVANDGFNRISPNFSISLGKYITPTWGIRGQVNGIWQSLCLQEIGYHEHNKNYVGANIDAMVNLSSLLQALILTVSLKFMVCRSSVICCKICKCCLYLRWQHR